MYGKCGVSKVVWGALLLLNGFLWPRWTGVDGWIKWWAVLMVLTGLAILIWPEKCGVSVSAPSANKKRRKR